MKLLVVPDEFPLPVNSGGRVDTWRRLQALQANGFDLAVLTWYNAARDGAPAATTMAQAHAIVPHWHLVPVTQSAPELALRLSFLGRLPSHAAVRWVTLDRPSVLAWARAFAPDAILLDRLYGAAVTRWLAAEIGVPWVYRSHNREADYMRGQAVRALTWRARAGLWLNQLGLDSFERRVISEAHTVFDISVEDAAYWRAQSCEHVQWLPPVVDTLFASEVSARACSTPDWDLLYFGNLNTPNNLEALAWLVDHVFPRLPDSRLRIAVAGSRPAAQALALVARDPRITLFADPVTMAPLVGAARVLLNPMRSGSGVNLKSVDMMCAPAHRVSTTIGVAGLPAEAKACFFVCDEAAGFASGIERALAHGDRPPIPTSWAQFSAAEVARQIRAALAIPHAAGRSETKRG